MDLSNDPTQDEARIMERQLYRPGQTPSAPKTTAASRSSSPAPRSVSKKSDPSTGPKAARIKHILAVVLLGGFGYYLLYGTPQTRRRILKVLGAALWLFTLGSVSYCIFLPDPVAEIKGAFAEMRSLSPEQRRAKFREVRSLMRELTPQQQFELGKERRKKEYDQLSDFMKLSPDERFEQTKKELLDEKARRDRRASQRGVAGRRGGNGNARGGGNAGAPNRGGGAPGAAGGAGRGGVGGVGGGGPGGGGPGGGGPGGGRMGRGGGGPGAGGPGRGGPGGRRGSDPEARKNREKKRLDSSDPESRAMRSFQRGFKQQVRQQLGLPSGGGRGGRGGPPGGPGGRR